MFGLRGNPAHHPGEIRLADVHPDLPTDATELARFWVTSERSFVAVGFQKAWSPELLGSLVVECLHNAADALSTVKEGSREEVLSLLWKGLDEERERLAANSAKDIR